VGSLPFPLRYPFTIARSNLKTQIATIQDEDERNHKYYPSEQPFPVRNCGPPTSEHWSSAANGCDKQGQYR
jgi:hypothetical protein